MTQVEALQKTLEKAKQEVLDIEAEIKAATSRDLIAEKKIAWKTMSFNQWFKKHRLDRMPFFVYVTEDGKEKRGIWNGLTDLTHQEEAHFEEYHNHYHYYGHPNYDGDAARKKAFDTGRVLTYRFNSNTQYHPRR